MSIRVKIILVVLPLLVATLVLSSLASSFSARNGITRVAVEFLAFKAQDLRNYMDNQWNLLVANELTGRAEYVAAVKRASLAYARSLAGSETALIFAVDERADTVFATGELALTETERRTLIGLRAQGREGWVELSLQGVPRVASAFVFVPFGWYCLISEESAAFYQEVTEITTRNLYILLAACALSVVLLLLFSRYLTGPVTRMARAMREIMASHDLSARVEVEFRDEIGALAHTFNLTVGELEKAYSEIKQYALDAVLAQKREHKIRNIFQKYVPADVIEQFFRNPESMLIGKKGFVAVLFADIRGFTALSEGMRPDEMVESLNAYFTVMVDVIMRRGGVVDKYIGDAIMAVFGTPVEHDEDALQAVLTAIDMNAALARFNREQASRGKPEFRIGIGIVFGEVTVGNIGTEKKMDYTVIGDMVNLASRLENLTKTYKQNLLFSESVYALVSGSLECRLIDNVAVHGKSRGERIFTAKLRLDEEERKGWELHHAGIELYNQREFAKAADRFRQVQEYIPGDVVSAMLYDRCRAYLSNPPPADWAGVHALTEK
ncbi:MAG: adenylate/guanylate cyclase domain-containing protein [Spirochaetales bacterium]|nr:adenylate/guanylate cyclase domain-containing protein [Spirochaetales bacterium]